MTLHLSEFEGGNPLSPFRIQHILPRLQAVAPAIQGLSAHFVHWVACAEPMSAADQARVHALLTYGDPRVLVKAKASSLIVVAPRLGTESPSWTAIKTAAPMLADLREESRIRLKALRERPRPGSIQSQFLALSPRTRHAIAVDTSKSRLYLFENSAEGLKLIADYYTSIGKSGIEKNLEGDQRTPLDVSRGKTGGGIWLHGTPPGQFSRAPKASDG